MGMDAFSARVMTWNLRFPNPRDEGNLWAGRREMVVELLREYAPDLVGLQEAYRDQLDYIAAQMPAYTVIGRERRGGRDEEHCAVLVRGGRFMLEACGTYWLSDDPDTPGSRTWWPDDHPRVVTWARMLHLASGSAFLHLNTHFPLGTDDLRARSAALVWQRLQRGDDVPAIVTGDFNTGPDSLPHRVLTGKGPMPDGSRADARDAWETAPDRIGPAATYHGFTGTPSHNGRRIDWILLRGAVRAERVETVTFSRNGKYPSDHFPVAADLVIGGSSGK